MILCNKYHVLRASSCLVKGVIYNMVKNTASVLRVVLSAQFQFGSAHAQHNARIQLCDHQGADACAGAAAVTGAAAALGAPSPPE